MYKINRLVISYKDFHACPTIGIKLRAFLIIALFGTLM